jgi:Uma2 family endonuclease
MSIDISVGSDIREGSVAISTPIDLARKFGDIPLWRIRFAPPPGEATEEDCLTINERKDGLCELVDGTPIEKVRGAYESLIAVVLSTLLNAYLKSLPTRPGIVLGADGMLKLRVKLIRVPDVSYLSREHLARGKFPRRGVAVVAPTIAVEVISEGNTKREMQEKLAEYFSFGAAEVWYLYPVTKTIVQYTSPEQCTTLTEWDVLTTAVLPGFSCPVGPLFVHPDEEFLERDDQPEAKYRLLFTIYPYDAARR